MKTKKKIVTRAPNRRAPLVGVLVAGAAALQLVAGCSGDASVDREEGAAEAPDVELSASGDEIVPKSQDWFEWSNATPGAFDPNVFMCTLSQVKGGFVNERAAGVRLTSAGWSIQGSTGLSPRMACTKYSNFTRPSGSVNWFTPNEPNPYACSTCVGGFTGPNTWEPWGALAVVPKPDPDFQNAGLFWGNAITAITGMRGVFDNEEHDVIDLTQSINATVPSGQAVFRDAPGRVQGGARSFFLGNPNLTPTLVKLWGYNTSGAWARGDTTLPGTFEFNVNSESGFSSFWMAPTTPSAAPTGGGFCVLTRIAGDFNGIGESLSITEQNGRWFLAAVAGSGAVRGSARCVAYNQL